MSVTATMPAALLARRIVTAIEGARIDVSSEVAAHQRIFEALARAGMDAATEVDLGEFGRIDLMVGAVGIEVKIGGGRRAIFDQAKRYLDCPQIEALVLATAGAWPKSAAERLRSSGHPVLVASLARGWL